MKIPPATYIFKRLTLDFTCKKKKEKKSIYIYIRTEEAGDKTVRMESLLRVLMQGHNSAQYLAPQMTFEALNDACNKEQETMTVPSYSMTNSFHYFHGMSSTFGVLISRITSV